MRLILAPMQGLLDDVLREVLTGLDDYDWAVSEFARVSDTLLPPRFYRRLCPELDHGSRTRAGTPLRVQLLGSDPVCLQDNAARLAALAPAGIDLNFGCPAPTVNRHRGGAVLLDEPELLHRIAACVRTAVPPGTPYSAKMRLGVADKTRAVECAQALADGGVELLVVHARTKLEGYRPPAHWSWVARVAESVRIPVVANGEVWSVADWLRCRSESGVADVMLGRGAVADPFLAGRIRRAATLGTAGSADGGDGDDWSRLLPALSDFWARVQRKVEPRHAPGRLKQWLGLLAQRHPQAGRLLADIRACRLPLEIAPLLRRHGVPQQVTGNALAHPEFARAA
ncbi:MAG: tRNA dihydrouridine synthase [Rhodocyclaceae bacterium]